MTAASWNLLELAAILKMEAVRSSKTPANFYRTTRDYISEYSTLYIPIIQRKFY
jgi:hypothetical protein